MKEIKNARIESADLCIEDHGFFCVELLLRGDGWSVGFGNVAIGRVLSGKKGFEGTSKGIEEIMSIMSVVGVDKFSDLKGKYVRIELNGLGYPVKKIGNIIEDKWFDYEEFYREKEEWKKNEG
jgi:hypothetical protein